MTLDALIYFRFPVVRISCILHIGIEAFSNLSSRIGISVLNKPMFRTRSLQIPWSRLVQTVLVMLSLIFNPALLITLLMEKIPVSVPII